MSFQELAAIKSPLLRGLVLNPPERRSEEEMNAFFSENQPDLERKIGAALDEVIGMKYSGAPAAIVGQKLLESEGIDVSLISPMVHGVDEKPQGHDLELRRIVSTAKLATQQRALSSPDFQLRSPSPTPSTAPSEDGNLTWTMNAWIKSINTPKSIDEIVCDACLAPLREDRSELGGSIEQEFIRQLGDYDSHEMILKLLQTPESNVLEEIAQAIYKAAKKLNGETADAEEADEASTPAASKFFEDGEGSLKFGEISTFYEGLDGFLGPPNPNLREAMENEHCKSADATAIFRVPDYYTHTTSELEYWFVVDPTQEKLEELRFVRSPCDVISLRASLIRSPSDLPACLCVASLFAARFPTARSTSSAMGPNGPPSRKSTACRSARRVRTVRTTQTRRFKARATRGVKSCRSASTRPR